MKQIARNRRRRCGGGRPAIAGFFVTGTSAHIAAQTPAAAKVEAVAAAPKPK